MECYHSKSLWNWDITPLTEDITQSHWQTRQVGINVDMDNQLRFVVLWDLIHMKISQGPMS